MTKARDLADLGNKTSLDEINDAYDAGAFSNRNMVTNGAMVINQRNEVFTNPNGHFPVDRFAVGNYIPSTTTEQSTTAPSGYSNSLKVTNGTATVPSNQFFTYQVYQFIEGFNTAPLLFGNSSAKTVTLSFWVRSSITGTFAVTLQNSARDRSYISTYTINQADTFEKKTITVNGDVAGTWVGATNGIGLRLIFDIGSGTNRETTAGAWQSGNYTRTSGSARINTTTGATFYITGVQLEVGDTATPFEHKNVGQELLACQRYYFQKSFAAGDRNLGSGRWEGNGAGITVSFPVQMRGLPTLSIDATGMQAVEPTVAWYTLTGTVNPHKNSFTSNESFYLTSGNGTNKGTTTIAFQSGGRVSFDAEL